MISGIRSRGTALALAACFAILGAVGCGGGGSGGGGGAALKKADAVTVTYYYLPG